MTIEAYCSAINTTGTPSGGGSFKMDGLPFACESQPVFAVSSSGGNVNFNSIIGIGSTTSVVFSISTGSTSNQSYYGSVTYTSGIIRVTGTYLTTA